MTTSQTGAEQPTIYASVARTLADQWRRKAQGLRENDDDASAALAYGIEYCASQLEGLADL